MARNKKAKAPKEKKTLKERFKKGNVELPNCIQVSITKLYFLAIGVFIIGFILAIWSRDWIVGVLTLIMALGIAGYAFYKSIKLSNEGFLEAVGTVVKVDYTVGSQILGAATNGKTKDIPTRFLIDVDGELYSIPYYKQWQLLDEGDVIKLYLNKNANLLSVRGVYTPDGVLGYEIYLGDKEDE
jgi:hypothetical protein